MASRVHCHFNVAPRYTPGSPAMVDERTALRVAMEERGQYPFVLQGVSGLTEQLIAKDKGLDGIVECRVERPGFWIVTDLITLKVYRREMMSHETMHCRDCSDRKPLRRGGPRTARNMLAHTRPSPLTGETEPCPGGVVPLQQEVMPDSSYWKFRYRIVED